MNFNLFINKIKNHYLAIVVCIFFTLAIISPRIISQFIDGNEFKGIYPTFIEDEIHYESRISEVLTGHIFLGNSYIKEHEDDVFLMPPLPEWIIALFIYITGVNVPLGIILTSLLIIPIFFLLTYLLFLRINSNQIISVAFTSLFFLLFFQTFGRPVSPQLNFIFLLVGLILLHDIFFRGQSFTQKNKNIILGIITGITIFISPYYFTTIISVYIFQMVYRFFTVENRKQIYNELLFFLVPLFVFVVFYGYFLISASRSIGYREVTTRLGIIYSHWPGSYSNIILGILATLLLVISYSFFKKKKDWFFAMSFVISIFALNWQNIITGQALQFPSHYLVVTILFVLVSLAYIVKSVMHSSFVFNTKKIFFVFILLLLTVALLLFRQKNEFTTWIPKVPNKYELVELQKDRVIFDWLNNNTKSRDVVYVLDERLNSKMIVYTKNKVFYERYSALYLISDDEVVDRWLIQNYFVPTIDKEYVIKNQKDIWWNRYVDPYFFNQNKNKILSIIFRNSAVSPDMIPDNIVNNVLDRNEMIHKQKPSDIFQKYDLDYIVLNKDYSYYKEASKKIAKIPNIHYVVGIDNVDIYKVD